MSKMTATQSAQDKKLIVFIKLLLVIIFWGMNVIVTKYLTTYLVTASLVTLRLILATGVLLPIAVRRHGFVRLSPQGWLLVSGIALMNFLVHQLSLAWGVANTSGTHAVLILGLLPLATALLASIFLKEGLNGGKIFGLILAFGGVALVALNKGSAQVTVLGDLLMFVAMIAYATGSVIVKKCAVHAPSVIISAYSLAVASLVSLVIMLVSGAGINITEAGQPGPIAAILYLGWISTALGNLWWNEAIYKIGAATTSIFFNGVPVVGVIGSVVFLGDKLLPAHLFALVLILLGVSLGTGGGFDRIRGALTRKQGTEQAAE